MTAETATIPTQAEAQPLPTGWHWARLGDVIREAQNGFAEGKRDPQGVIQLRMNNVKQDGSLDWTAFIRVPADRRKVEKYRLQEGDVVFTNTNSTELVGKSILFPETAEPVVYSNHFTRLRTEPRTLIPAFLAYWLRWQWERGTFARLCQRWIGQSAIHSEKLLGLRLPLPPLAEQRRIVAILDAADELRRLRAEADRRTAALVPAIFHEMFGDPASNPEGWELRRLGDVGQLDRGRSKHRPRNDPRLYGDRYPFIQTGDIANSNGHIATCSQWYSDLGLAQSRIWPAGTLVITIAANIAKTAVLAFPACFPDSVVGFTPGDRVQVAYVRQWLVGVAAHIEEAAPQAAQKNINLRILNDLEVPVPPLPLQRDFEERAAEARALEERQAASRARLEALFQALLARAFGGEI